MKVFRLTTIALSLTLLVACGATVVWNTATVEDVVNLLDIGGDINARDERGATPLHGAAAHSKNPEVVALLIDRGADVEARDEDGWTPLHGAAGSNTLGVIGLLIDRGADVSAREKKESYLCILQRD